MLKQNKKGKWVVDFWYFGLNKEGERQRYAEAENLP